MAVRGRHKARNPWEYRACASGPARVLHELWGGLPTLLSPVFFFPFFLSRFFLFLVWDSVTWRIHGYLNHVARPQGIGVVCPRVPRLPTPPRSSSWSPRGSLWTTLTPRFNDSSIDGPFFILFLYKLLLRP